VEGEHVRVQRDESGATAVEYALLASLIAAVIAATVQLIGEGLIDAFTSVAWW
jgi:pilus assembly protein Flp/PilA